MNSENSITTLVKISQSPALGRVSNLLALTDKLLTKPEEEELKHIQLFDLYSTYLELKFKQGKFSLVEIIHDFIKATQEELNEEKLSIIKRMYLKYRIKAENTLSAKMDDLNSIGMITLKEANRNFNQNQINELGLSKNTHITNDHDINTESLENSPKPSSAFSKLSKEKQEKVRLVLAAMISSRIKRKQ